MNPTKLANTTSPLILGHRGASAIAPENTLAAFARALSDGADGIEFDVRLSSDGVPVVIHDDTLRRTGGRKETVSSLSAAQLQQVNVGGWFDPAFAAEKLPSLDQVFQMFEATGGVLNVEMKCTPNDVLTLAQAVVESTKQFAFEDRAIVSSFDLNAIAAIKNLYSAVQTAALFEPRFSHPVTTLRRSKMIDAALAAKTEVIALHHTLATASMLERSRAAGLEVIVWTVDEPVWVEKARTFEIKALISNNPGAMVHTREAIAR